LQLDINGDSVVDFTTSTNTDSNGAYSFTNLLPGTYSLTVSSTGFAAATSPVVDPDGTNDGTTIVSLTPSSTNLNQDFGYPGTTIDPTTMPKTWRRLARWSPTPLLSATQAPPMPSTQS
jgi:hypothetical protein